MWGKLVCGEEGSGERREKAGGGGGGGVHVGADRVPVRLESFDARLAIGDHQRATHWAG